MPKKVRVSSKLTTPRAFARWVNDLLPIDAGLGMIVRVTISLALAPEAVMANGRPAGAAVPADLGAVAPAALGAVAPAALGAVAPAALGAVAPAVVLAE